MFTNSRNVLVTGGTITHHGNVFNILSEGTHSNQRYIDQLVRHIAIGAVHNSAERSDPPRCHPDTRSAVLKDIMDWIQHSNAMQKLLWIHGPAGAGKTAIAQTISELCDEDGILAASFFFSRTEVHRSNGTRFIATLAYQLTVSVPEMTDHIIEAVRRDPMVFARTLAVQMKRLIIEPIDRVLELHGQDILDRRPKLIIVDGLDECDIMDGQRHILATLAAHLGQLTVHFLFLIFSRPEQVIRDSFTRDPLRSTIIALALNSKYNPDNDIRIFLNEAFNEIRKTHPSGAHLPISWPSESDIDQLAARSSTQFIYVVTMVKYIRSPRHRPPERLAIVLGSSKSQYDGPFADLDALYLQIFSAVQDVESLRQILELIILELDDQVLHTLRLTEQFIETLLGFQRGDVQIILRDMHALMHVPGGMYSEEIVHLHHASLAEFLLDKSRSGHLFIDVDKAHSHIAIHHLRYLTRMAPQNVAEGKFYANFEAFLRIMGHCVRTRYANDILRDKLHELPLGEYIEHILEYYSHRQISVVDATINLTVQFFRWLEMQDGGAAMSSLLRSQRREFDNWLGSHLARFPLEIQTFLPAALTFPDLFSISGNTIFKVLLEDDSYWQSGFYIFYSNSITPDFLVLVREALTNRARGKEYFVGSMEYANLASVLLDFIVRRKMNRQWGNDISATKIAMRLMMLSLSKTSRNSSLSSLCRRHLRQLRLGEDTASGDRRDLVASMMKYIRDCEADSTSTPKISCLPHLH